MKHLKIMKASTWFSDSNENGFIIVTKDSVLEFGFHALTLPSINFDLDDGYHILLNIGAFSIALTSKE